MNIKGSSVGTLSKFDWQKVGVGLGVALIGAALTYVTDALPHVDLGEWTPLVVAGWSAFANIIRKFLSDTRY